MKRYSRLIVLFGGTIASVAINFWLITTGHYRWPLVVLVAYLVGIPSVFRKLPPVTRDSQQIRGYQLDAVSRSLIPVLCLPDLKGDCQTLRLYPDPKTSSRAESV